MKKFMFVLSLSLLVMGCSAEQMRRFSRACRDNPTAFQSFQYQSGASIRAGNNSNNPRNRDIFVNCHSCNGSGKIHRLDRYGLKNYFASKQICPVCGGTGKTRR